MIILNIHYLKIIIIKKTQIIMKLLLHMVYNATSKCSEHMEGFYFMAKQKTKKGKWVFFYEHTSHIMTLTTIIPSYGKSDVAKLHQMSF